MSKHQNTATHGSVLALVVASTPAAQDGAVKYAGERWDDTANSFKTPVVTILSLGAHRIFALAGRPAEFRLLASNLGGAEGCSVSPSGVLTPIPPRAVRVSLTISKDCVISPKGAA